jgi:hypothetical protein
VGSIPAPGTHVARAPFAPVAVFRRLAVGALRLGRRARFPPPALRSLRSVRAGGRPSGAWPSARGPSAGGFDSRPRHNQINDYQGVPLHVDVLHHFEC